MFNFQPKDQIYSCLNNIQPINKCTKNIETEVAVIGGGMAGLSAAQAFTNKGKKVALFEQYYCGSGASGKSTGFVTSNTELSFSDIAEKAGLDTAKTFWNFILNGVHSIKNNIEKYNLSCDIKNDSGLLVSNCKKTAKNILKEYEYLQEIGYQTNFFDTQDLQQKINTKNYINAVGYNGDFGINGFKYCQELKRALSEQGVSIFEETPVLSIDNHTLTTLHAKINAKYIIVCVDKFLPEFQINTDKVYHAQTFVLASQQLEIDTIKKIFPENPYMICDSELIYNYYRITPDNRLLLGGGDIWSTYSKHEKHNYKRIYKKLINYFSQTFPEVKINFEYQWPGHIGISKDLFPVAGPDKKNPHIYYISSATGLSTASALGIYSQEHLLEGRQDLDTLFDPDRKYFIQGLPQKFLGTQASFALNNFVTQKNLGCFKI